MKTTNLLVVVLGFIWLCIFNIFAGPKLLVNAAPALQLGGDGTPNIASCLEFRCDSATGPVCGIDSTGVPRTFENRCLADLAYCSEGRYYAIVKHGEC